MTALMAASKAKGLPNQQEEVVLVEGVVLEVHAIE
jgi:hypothetical protein